MSGGRPGPVGARWGHPAAVKDPLRRLDGALDRRFFPPELLAGMRPDELDPTELFMSALTWVPVDEEISRVAGSMAEKYRKAHSGIDAIDYLIAATATVVGAGLLTTNVCHFQMITGLQPPYVN